MSGGTGRLRMGGTTALLEVGRFLSQASRVERSTCLGGLGGRLARMVLCWPAPTSTDLPRLETCTLPSTTVTTATLLLALKRTSRRVPLVAARAVPACTTWGCESPCTTWRKSSPLERVLCRGSLISTS